ncbi:hypothetical protein [Megasphaera elsdenii]|uniref:hypothetical protein n=1 Tax=Megasphaera elsdenii TaxID=907 RepID=UPI003520C05D
MASNPRKSAQTKIKKKLDALFTNVPAEKQAAAELLTKRAAFLLAAEDELERVMQANGYVDVYDNGGGQTGTMVSATLKAYTQCNQQLLSTIRQLREFLPADDSAGRDELTEFLKQHK